MRAMRIISQDGRLDFPYEFNGVERVGNSITVAGVQFAEYETEEKAISELEALRDAYMSYVSRNLMYGKNSKFMIDKATERELLGSVGYFQFSK